MNTSPTKEPRSLLFNEIIWRVKRLSEQVLLLEAPEGTHIDQIHTSKQLIEDTLDQELTDIVPAYDSIAIFSNQPFDKTIDRLQASKVEKYSEKKETDFITIPICYELGVDLEDVSEKVGLSREDLIELHLQGTYKSTFIGFTPGFVYAEGLDPRLGCARKTSPRTMVPAGSIGIGGKQTGIYSLDSPGGWNIIGRTPLKLFDISKRPPMKIGVGTSYQFTRISKKEFEQWED